MNRKESNILIELKTDISWIKNKQTEHDKKLDGIDRRLRKGTGKIARNFTLIKAIGTALSVIFIVLCYIVFY